MTPQRRESCRQEDLHPTPRAGKKCNRGQKGCDSELSLHRAAVALHAATNPEEACRIALSVLVGPSGVDYPLALLFLRDEEEGMLRGYAACRAPASSGSVGESHSVSKKAKGPEPPESIRPRESEASGPDAHEAPDGDQETVRGLRVPLHPGAEFPLVRALHAKHPVVMETGDQPVLQELLQAYPEPPGGWILVPTRGLQGAVGVLVLGVAKEPGGAGPKDLTAIEILASHMGLMLERLETHAALGRQLPAYAFIQETTRAMLSATSLGDVLTLLARGAAKIVGAGRAMTWTYDEASRELNLAAQSISTASDTLNAVFPRFQYLARLCAQQGGALLYRDLRQEPGVNLESLPKPLSGVVVPLSAFGEILGVLAVIDKAMQEPPQCDHFTQEDEDLLDFLAGLAAVTIKNARLHDRLRDSERSLRETQRMLLETEKIASLGELSARLISEIRKPLSAIAGFGRRIERRLKEGDPSKEDAGMLAREARRIEEVIAQQVGLAEAPAPRLAMQQLTKIIHETVALVREELTGRGVFLEEIYTEQIPDMLLDRERVKRVVLNILRNSLEAVRDGDTVRLETLREGDRVLIEIANTGEQLPGEILERLFVPFDIARPSGTGLGLAMAQQIVKEHGGEISVRSEGEWGTIFTVSFPIRANQERRKVRNRRSGKDRRRPQGRGGKKAA